MSYRSYLDFCCRRLSSHTVRTTIFISTSRAFGEISCAGQTGFVCEALQAPSARSCRFEKSPPNPVQRVRTYQLRGAPHGALVPAGPGAREQILLAASRKSAHTVSQRREEALNSTPTRFLLQELIFDRCPYRPRRPIRGNLLTKSDWLCLRGIAGTECDIS